MKCTDHFVAQLVHKIRVVLLKFRHIPLLLRCNHDLLRIQLEEDQCLYIKKVYYFALGVFLSDDL